MAAGRIYEQQDTAQLHRSHWILVGDRARSFRFGDVASGAKPVRSWQGPPPLTDFQLTKMNAGLGGCHRLDAHGTRKRHSGKDKFMVRLSLFQIHVKRFILTAIRKTGS
jgi:hypothetical protein